MERESEWGGANFIYGESRPSRVCRQTPCARGCFFSAAGSWEEAAAEEDVELEAFDEEAAEGEEEAAEAADARRPQIRR